MTTCIGSIMAQTISRRLLTAEAWVQFQVSSCGICGGQSGTGTDFYLSTSVLPCHYHSSIASFNSTFRTPHMYTVTLLYNSQHVLDTALEMAY
jgi:hypothetical protein